MIGEWEVPRIERIETLEGRRIARLPVPGLLGDIQQDLGAASLTVEIAGSLHGDEARDDFLQSLRESFGPVIRSRSRPTSRTRPSSIGC